MNRHAARIALFLTLIAGRAVCAEEVSMVRFDPPRAVLLHPTVNKSGPAAAIKGQDNFLTLYMPAVKNTQDYSPDQFTLSVLLPTYLEVLDVQEQGLAISPAEHKGQPYQQVTLKLDASQVKARCFDNTWGETQELWFRVKEGVTIPAEPQPIAVTLKHRGTECFTDRALLRIHDAIRPGPRVSQKHFKIWLHYGPHVRKGQPAELAQTLTLAGINALQYTLGSAGAEEEIRAMRQRGFYIIIQRSGSYSEIYADHMRGCLEQGAKWFEKADQGTMNAYLPLADAVLWDYEPNPMPDNLDDWLIGEFRRSQKLPADDLLTADTIRTKYLRQFIEFRQRQLATCVKHWADYCRSLKPGVDTILTEGGVLAFDPLKQVDYANYQDFVTYCDPMNFTGIEALQVVRQYQKHAPRARFTGCQNVALSAYHNVFISPATIKMQTLSAAIIGQHGTSVYPGQAMDADNFVELAKVAAFMGRHEKLMFESRPDPATVQLELLPKEQHVVDLGDGRKVRTTYPDWEQDAIQRAYAGDNGSEILVVVANWHAKEPAHGKLSATLATGQWLLLDDDNEQVFTQAGRVGLASDLFARGIPVSCPAFDYRGWRITRATPAALESAKKYRAVKLEDVAKQVAAYSQAAADGLKAAAPKSTDPNAHLLFHASFDGSPDATVARGEAAATVTGTPSYEDTENGKGIVISKGNSVTYLPTGNIKLERGRLAIRFKPRWEGADPKAHMLLTVRPQSGYLYLGKLDDGRFLMNMFGPKDDQHYGFHVIRSVRAGTWHEAVVSWDTEKGLMLLFFDGRKVAEYRSDPWTMAPLDNSLAHCRMVIPDDADAVIDDLKIWGEP